VNKVKIKDHILKVIEYVSKSDKKHAYILIKQLGYEKKEILIQALEDQSLCSITKEGREFLHK
jgi:hypothetical protein